MKTKAVHSFTYYIPPPPERRHGYQEKNFDKIIAFLQAQGHELLSWQTQACPKSGGMWFISLWKTKNRQAIILDEQLLPEGHTAHHELP
jgi:hypothetical protein